MSLGPPPHPLLGTSPSATFLLRPWAVVVRATVVGVAGWCRNSSRIVVRDMLSCQSLIPAGAGTPWYENCGRSSVDVFECHCCLESGFPL